MPRVWSWYQSVQARWLFGYWNVADPGAHSTPNRPAALARKNSYQVPCVA